MAKTTEKYEAVTIFSLKNGDENVKSLIEKFSDLIKENAELVEVNEWANASLLILSIMKTTAIMLFTILMQSPNSPQNLSVL